MPLHPDSGGTMRLGIHRITEICPQLPFFPFLTGYDINFLILAFQSLTVR